MKINKNHVFSNYFEVTNSNFSRNIEFLVFHHIESEDINSAIALLKNHQVSSHYIINDNGDIYQLVDENNIAYHAGHSYFKECHGLNKSSIGIELFNKDVNSNKFNKEQLDSLIALSKDIISRHNIEQQNIVGHSDIAYYATNSEGQIGLLDRKDDPSHMFDWHYMSKDGISIFPQQEFIDQDLVEYQDNDQHPQIAEIKQKLRNFGYKVEDINDHFDLEMRNLTRVFNRRFNPSKYLDNKDCWWLSSTFLLNQL